MLVFVGYDWQMAMQSNFLCAIGCFVLKRQNLLLAVTRYVLLAVTRSPFTGLDKPVGLHENEASRLSRQFGAWR